MKKLLALILLSFSLFANSAVVVADRIMETTTTTGTGNITLAGAVTAFRTFASVCSTNDTFRYTIAAVDANGSQTGEWETGYGTYSASNTLTRTTVESSSNSNSAVSFSAGTKRVWLDISAASVPRIATGKTVTINNTLTLAGTDSTTMTFPSTSATVARTDAANTFTGHQTIEGVTSTGATGTGKLVFDGTPTLVTPVLGAATGTSITLSGGSFIGAKGADIASNSTVNLDTSTGNLVHITGTTTITAFTIASGSSRVLVFDGALTLTYNATTLIIPGSANVTTAAGDIAVVVGDGSNNGRVVSYTKRDGTALVSSGGGATWLRKTSGYTAAANDAILVDTSGGVVTITLPASASQGDVVGPLVDAAGTFQTNNLTVAANGLKIMGSTANMTVNTQYASFALVYDGATNGWRIYQK